jgi:hypothetical protein
MSKPELELIKGGEIPNAYIRKLAKIEVLSKGANNVPFVFTGDREAVERLMKIIENSESDSQVLADAVVRFQYNRMIFLEPDEFKLAKKSQFICENARRQMEELLAFYLESVKKT